MGSIEGRLRRLEKRGALRCPGCAGEAGIAVCYPGEVEDPGERCPRCGRAPTIIRVVYDGAVEEGGGA